jgi:hypothetical protein
MPKTFRKLLCRLSQLSCSTRCEAAHENHSERWMIVQFDGVAAGCLKPLERFVCCSFRQDRKGQRAIELEAAAGINRSSTRACNRINNFETSPF